MFKPPTKYIYNVVFICVLSIIPMSINQTGAQFSYNGINQNKLMKLVNGNRRLGYKLGIWNCRRGLVTPDKEASHKFFEAKEFIQSNNLHMFCLIETDLNGIISRYKRNNPLTENEIFDILAIPGYKLYLPTTWGKHGQARMFVYAKEDLNVKEWKLGESFTDLPMIRFLISVGKEKKTAVNFFYREFTGGVSGLDDVASQNERLKRLNNH